MLKRPLFIVVIVLLLTNVFTLILLNKNDDILLENEERITKNESVASIGSDKIEYADWIDDLRGAYGEKHLREMIDHSVVRQLAEQKGITIHEKLIDHGVALLATMQGVIKEDEFGKLEEKWRRDLLYRYQLGELLTEHEVITDEEIQTHYSEYQNQYNFTASVQLSHIIVDTMTEAERVVRELDDGASFHLLAIESSNDEDTNQAGGYLGYLAKTSQFLPANYYEVAMNMNEDSYSEPFQTDRGVAIIYLHRKLPDINFSYEEMKDEIRRELALKGMGQALNAGPLWEAFDINWIYGE